MDRTRRNFIRSAAVLSAIGLYTNTSWASDFPVRPITIVNPYQAGGGTDVLARALASELTKVIGQSVIVDNRPGAATTIAAAYVARAPADGYTLLLSQSQHAIVPTFMRSLPYDFLTDFAPIIILGESPFYLLIRPNQGIKDLEHFLTVLKSKGESMNYGSAGQGSIPHLVGESLNQALKTKVLHIPYPGVAPALSALLGGQVDFVFGDASTLPMIESGKVVALAATSKKRSPLFPQLPALGEIIPDSNFVNWIGLEAPLGTPESTIKKIHDSVRLVLQSPEILERYKQAARQMVPLKTEEITAFKAKEMQRYQRIAQEAGLKME